MNEKEKDTMIYNEICNIIQRKIDETCAVNETLANHMEGKVLTAKMLEKDINLLGFLEGLDENHTISVDTFSCNFPTRMMLDLAKKFKKISGAPERTFKYEIETTPVAEIFAPDGAKELFAFAGDDQWRPVLNHVHFDPETNCLVSSDGSVMAVFKAQANLSTELPHGVNIPKEIFKGKISRIDVSQKSESVVFANNRKCYTDGKYPKWESVVKKYSPNQMVVLGKNWRDFQKCVKSLIPFADEIRHMIQILGHAGEKEITLRVNNLDYGHVVENKIGIPVPLSQDISVSTDGRNLQKIKKATVMFVKDCCTPITFIDVNRYYLVMPVCDENRPFEMADNTDEKDLINPLVFASILDAEKSEEKPIEPKVEIPKEEPKEEMKKYLPAVIYKWNLKPISEYLPKPETEYHLKAQLCLPAPKVEEKAEEIPAVEIKTVNGITEGDFVLFTTFSGEKIACKVMAFSKDEKKAKLNLKGWNKFTVPVSLIEPTEMTRNTMPTWLSVGQVITDCGFTAEITDIKRSKIHFADGSEKTLKYVLMNCRPAEKPIIVDIPVSVIEPEKKSRWAWLKKLVRRAAVFSF